MCVRLCDDDDGCFCHRIQSFCVLAHTVKLMNTVTACVTVWLFAQFFMHIIQVSDSWMC